MEMIRNYNDQDYNFDDELSFKDFTLRQMQGYNLSGKVIYGSCFSQEIPDSQVFNPETTGATFIRCNLDNVLVPEGNTVIDCSQRRFQVQEDGLDWLVDENNQPVEPL